MAIEDEFNCKYASGGFNYDRKKMEKWLTTNAPCLLNGDGRTLLDVGCGDGFWTRILKGWGWRCQGIDESHTGINAAREKDSDSLYIPMDVFEASGIWDTVFVRTFPPFNMPIDKEFRSRLKFLWDLAKSQMVVILYSVKPYGRTIPGSNKMIYQNPADLDREIWALDPAQVDFRPAGHYFTWRIVRG